MKAIFTIEMVDHDGTTQSAFADNLLLDNGISYLRNTGVSSLFGNAIIIGSSNRPVLPTDPGLISTLSSKNATISPCELDDGAPYLFFTASAAFEEGEATGEWAEVSYAGWNRALLKAPGQLVDSTYEYAITSFNDAGESLPTALKSVTVASQSMASTLSNTQGFVSLPNRIDIEGKTVIDETFQLQLMTLTWAKNVAGAAIWIAATRAQPDLGNHSIAFDVDRNGVYYWTYENNRVPFDPQPIAGVASEQTITIPGPGTSAKWKGKFKTMFQWPYKVGNNQWRDRFGSLVVEAQIFGSGQTVQIDQASWTGIWRSYYKVTTSNGTILTTPPNESLPEEYGWNPLYRAPVGPLIVFDLINAPSNRTDPSIIDAYRSGFTPFTEFWSPGSNLRHFGGQVLDHPNFKLTMWESPFIPGNDDRAQFKTFSAGKTGAAFLTWQHINTFGLSGWPRGYRVYRKKVDNSLGFMKEISASYNINVATQTLIGVTGDTHFWDNGYIIPGGPPVWTYNGPLTPDYATLAAEPTQGFVPRSFIKTDVTRARINTQIFFYDNASGVVKDILMFPVLPSVISGGSIDLDAVAKNDYGQVLLDKTFSWFALDGGTVIQNPLDSSKASYSNNVAGSYTIRITSGSIVRDFAIVVTEP